MIQILVGALALALLWTGCDDFDKDDEEFANTNARLASLKVNDKSVPFGSPGINPAGATPHQSSVLTDETFTVSASAETVGAATAWGIIPADDPDYETVAFGNEGTFTIDVATDEQKDYLLVVRVTSKDGLVIWYYQAKLTITEGGQPPPPPPDAQIPVFSLQPIDADYISGQIIEPLEVLAASGDGSAISYQWFNASSPTDAGIFTGETGTTYDPVVLPVGVHYFYAVATNESHTSKKTESARAKITVVEQEDAAMPQFTTEPLSAFYAGTVIAPLTVAATISDGTSGGDLTYQWYQANDESSPGTPIATGATYTPTLTAGNTEYYYVKATNTNTTVNGTKIVTAESARAKITVMALSPNKNPTAVTANNTALFRIDLGADFDITQYTHFTIGLNVTTNGTTAISPGSWEDIAVMQWEWDEGAICAVQVYPPTNNGGGSLPDQNWRWDLLNIGNGQAAHTNAAIPPYLFALASTGASQNIKDAPNSQNIDTEIPNIGNYGEYTIKPLRYLYFKTAGGWNSSTPQFLEVTGIKFYAGD